MTHECVSDEAVAADVEKYGLSVMLVSKDDECPKFGYSIGLYRNFDHPELKLPRSLRDAWRRHETMKPRPGYASLPACGIHHLRRWSMFEMMNPARWKRCVPRDFLRNNYEIFRDGARNRGLS
jgi:hypothetical protein